MLFGKRKRLDKTGNSIRSPALKPQRLGSGAGFWGHTKDAKQDVVGISPFRFFIQRQVGQTCTQVHSFLNVVLLLEVHVLHGYAWIMFDTSHSGFGPVMACEVLRKEFLDDLPVITEQLAKSETRFPQRDTERWQMTWRRVQLAVSQVHRASKVPSTCRIHACTGPLKSLKNRNRSDSMQFQPPLVLSLMTNQPEGVCKQPSTSDGWSKAWRLRCFSPVVPEVSYE